MTPEILILAAGSSSRMRGADKLLEDVDGEPLLARSARVALATGCRVTVTLSPDRPARLAALQGLAITPVMVPDAAQGMATSLITGLRALPTGAAVLMLLADLPELTTEDLQACLAVWAKDPRAIPRGAAVDGTPGHPVGFPPDLRAELLALTGDTGARAVLARHADRLHLVRLPGTHATTDHDTPEEWADWRANRAR
ncbi:MAG: nucleotidyltransferase family protein [Paracoccaceae bacterium]